MRFNSPVRFPLVLGSSFLLASAVLVACGKTTNSSQTHAAAPAPTPSYVNYPQNNGNYTPVSNTVSGPVIGGGGGGANLPPVVRDGGGVQPSWNGSTTPQDELATFDPQEELREGEMGNWVTIGSQQFFKPILAPEDTEWQPMQHGYWSYEAVRGFTWVSYERFGEITTHFGYWRHHEKYGWVWGYTNELRYRASVVTWFDHGDNIGWYPAMFDQPNLYTLDNRVGFDDGYWRGPQLLVQIGTPGFAFHVGFSVVDRRYITSTDIASHCLADRRQVFLVAHQAELAHRFFPYPGGDRKNAYVFITAHAAKPPLLGDVAVREVGGRRFMGFNVNQPPAKLPARELARGAIVRPMPTVVAAPIAPRVPPVAPATAPRVPGIGPRASVPPIQPRVGGESTVVKPVAPVGAQPRIVRTPPVPAAAAPTATPAPVAPVVKKSADAPAASIDPNTAPRAGTRRGPHPAPASTPVVRSRTDSASAAPQAAAPADAPKPAQRTADAGAAPTATPPAPAVHPRRRGVVGQ